MNETIKLQIDRNGKTVLTDFSWQFGIGNDHAFQLLRTDVCEHIKLAHDELGIKYIRFHGIFCDDMLVFQRFSDLKSFKALPQADNIGEISFKQVSVALDNVLKCGLKPFLELSFMPSALAERNPRRVYAIKIIPPCPRIWKNGVNLSKSLCNFFWNVTAKRRWKLGISRFGTNPICLSFSAAI